ncbi:hypothetical protein, partial [Paracraurococcus ruber]
CSAPILAALHRVFAEAVRAAERRLAGMGVQTDTARTPEQLDSFLRIETERWKSILHPPG